MTFFRTGKKTRNEKIEKLDYVLKLRGWQTEKKVE